MSTLAAVLPSSPPPAVTCILASCSVSAWTGRKQDRTAERAIVSATGADADRARAIKYLLPPHDGRVKAEASLRAAISARHRSLTLPWSEDGARILPAVALPAWSQEMARAIAPWERAADDLAAAYPMYLQDAARALGAMFKAREYPDPMTFRSRYRVRLSALPLPADDDWRRIADPAAAALARSGSGQALAGIAADAARDLAQRIVDVAQAVAVKLPAYTGTREGAFRDSLIGNIRELVPIIRDLDITGDPRIADAVADLERISQHEPDDLRASARLRTDVAADAQSIVDNLSGLI